MSAREELAKRLFEKLEHLDPCYDTGEWSELRDRDRDLFRLALNHTLLDKQLVLKALDED